MPLPCASRLGLTLSGGGFRATLFHLGVIRFLYDIKRLKEVKHICSVSGGSIMAAHLVLNWDRYTDYKDPTKFDEAASEIVGFVKQDIRGNIERWLYLRGAVGLLWFVAGLILIPKLYYRFGLTPAWIGAGVWVLVGLAAALWLIFGRSGRTQQLQRQYDLLYKVDIGAAASSKWFGLLFGLKQRLFGADARSRRIYRTAVVADLAKPEAPKLHILATSLTTTEMIAFDEEGLDWKDEYQKKLKRVDERLKRGQLSLSLPVAASSAFPPFFPPVRLDNDVLHCRAAQFGSVHRLTDGGIYDNLGLDGMLKATATTSFDLVVVSDAESPLDVGQATFDSTTGRNFRATYILMQRVGDYVRKSANTDLKLVQCELQTANVDDPANYKYSTPTDLQSDIIPIRTDLDGFSDIEIHLLVSHGYAVARKAWNVSSYGPVPTFEPWSPIPPAKGLEVVQNNGKAIGAKARSRWKALRLHPWNPREFTSWLCAALFCSAVLLIILWRIEYVRRSELTSEVGMITPKDDPIFVTNDWLKDQVKGFKPDAERQVISIKVTGNPQYGWLCPGRLTPEQCCLDIQDGYTFTGFVCRFQDINCENKPVVAMIPITPYMPHFALPQATGTVNRFVANVPQAIGAEDSIVVLGNLEKKEGVFLKNKGGDIDASHLNSIISLKTWRKD